MKRYLAALCSLIITLSVLLCSASATFEIENTATSEISLELTTSEKEDIIEIVKSLPLSERNSAFIALLSYKADALSAQIQNTMPLHEFPNYLQNCEVEEDVLDEIVVVDENTYIEFYSSGSFIVHNSYTVSSTPADETTASLNSGSYCTATKRSQTDAYNMFGYIVISVWAEGYFEYDNVNAPTAHIYDCKYEKYGILNAWDVQDWEEGTPSNESNKTAKFYGSGNFYWGITYEGNGWKIQNKHITVGYSCNKSGVMTSILEGFDYS